MELFRCPVCGAPLTRGARVLVCPKRHSFDLAAEGYAHLLPAAQMHAKSPATAGRWWRPAAGFWIRAGMPAFPTG